MHCPNPNHQTTATLTVTLYASYSASIFWRGRNIAKDGSIYTHFEHVAHQTATAKTHQTFKTKPYSDKIGFCYDI